MNISLDNFCFANGTNGADGGSGRIKWMRFQYQTNSTRITTQLKANGSCTAPCTNCYPSMAIGAITGELINWPIPYRIEPTLVNFPKGQWNALQVYLYLDNVPVSAGGKARIRAWINDKLITDTTTLPTLSAATGNDLKSVYWGDYWNGGFPQDQYWYMDQVIITSNRPNTTDSGGRYYIDPQTRVADFGVLTNPPSGVPPNPPSDIK